MPSLDFAWREHVLYNVTVPSSSATISTASLKRSALEKESGESIREGESIPRREGPPAPPVPLASPCSL